MRKFSKSLLALVLVAVMAVSLIASATAAVVRDDSGNISYTPLEQGVYSNGGYTIDKVSHPTLGAGEVDAILSGKDQDRSNSYSWSMAGRRRGQRLHLYWHLRQCHMASVPPQRTDDP